MILHVWRTQTLLSCYWFAFILDALLYATLGTALFIIHKLAFFFVYVVAAITAAALATVFAPTLDAALAAALAAGFAAAPAAAKLCRNG